MSKFFQNLRVYAVFVAACLLDALGVTYGPQPIYNRAMRRQLGAVVNVTSTVIANADATPVTINKAFLARARLSQMHAVCTAANGDSINSTYRFGRIKSNDYVRMIQLDCAAIGAGALMDIGLYDTAANGGAAVSQALFASAIDISAALRAQDVTRESGTITVANMEKRIWELLGLAKDPFKDYDVVGTLTAAAAAAGAMCVHIEVSGEN